MIVAGFGFRSTATAESLASALARAGGADNSVSALATACDKAKGPPFSSFAGELALPVHAIDAATLARQETMTLSAASQAARGTGSVAEASALAAAGPGAQLLAPRAISRDGKATCALAKGEGR